MASRKNSDPDHDSDHQSHSPHEGGGGKLGDLLKKVATAGISAAFMTEDAVKTLLTDLPIPKDALNGLLGMAKQTKEEFVHSAKTELKSYLNRIDISREIDRIVENYDFEIKANISLKRKKKSDAPES